MSGRSRRSAALATALMASSTTAARSDDHPVATAPIDYSVYRDGAVQRVERRFGAWTLTCDEIKSLSRKFCSLRALARAADGTIIAALAVSTDDGGRPAALVTLPFGTLLTSGMIVMKAGPKKPAARLDLRPAVCDDQGCQVVWSLARDDIRTLSLGSPLKMNFAMTTGTGRALIFDPTPPRTVVEGSLPTDGFADALQASIQQ